MPFQLFIESHESQRLFNLLNIILRLIFFSENFHEDI